MDKVYIRKGRRFVAVPNVVGMFYDGAEFTKERTPLSFAFCYDQNGNTAMLTLLNVERGTFTWYEARENCIKPYHLPSREQILLARKRYESKRYELKRYESFPINISIWTCDAHKGFSSYVYESRETFGGFFSYPNDFNTKVLLFFETEIV